MLTEKTNDPTRRKFQACNAIFSLRQKWNLISINAGGLPSASDCSLGKKSLQSNTQNTLVIWNSDILFFNFGIKTRLKIGWRTILWFSLQKIFHILLPILEDKTKWHQQHWRVSWHGELLLFLLLLMLLLLLLLTAATTVVAVGVADKISTTPQSAVLYLLCSFAGCVTVCVESLLGICRFFYV